MEIATMIIIILIAAGLVEFIVQRLKDVIPCAVAKYFTPPLQAVVLGVVIAILYRLDLMAALGFMTPYALASWIITGLAISAGSVPLHELIAKLRASRQDINPNG